MIKALSIHAPWWWCILHAGKNIENRNWPTQYRGTVYIHASKWWESEEVEAGRLYANHLYRGDFSAPPRGKIMTSDDMRRHGGHLVGSVEIVDCVTESDSPWFFGKYGFVLANPIAFACPVELRGMQGLFPVPDNVAAVAALQARSRQ